MNNNQIIERLFAFATAVRGKNAAISTALNRAAIPLLECPQTLATASREDLLTIKGVGPTTVQYIQRIIAGEEIDAVVEDVPENVRVPQQRHSHYESPDRGNWNGSWDNSVRQVEGD